MASAPEKFWEYHPQLIHKDVFANLYPQALILCQGYTNTVYGKVYLAKRVSCYFSNNPASRQNEVSAKSKYFDYSNLPVYDWSASEDISNIKTVIEDKFKTTYDYCLMHIYRDGNDTIGYHRDKEALTTDIASVSLGASRKFRFRKLGQTKSWEEEFVLHNGDVLLMKEGCQQNYQHSVPVEKKVKEPRINLTFRKLQ